MKFVNEIDLKTREVKNKKTYDLIKGVIKNQMKDNLIKNEIFNITKAILYSNNEYNILILNLLYLTLIKHYNNEENFKMSQDYVIYNPLLLPFFAKDIYSLDNPDSLFQLLIKIIKSENNFRISSYEIILYNIQSLINIYIAKFANDNIESNAENENQQIQVISKIKNILIEVFKFQIKKIKKLF